MAIVIQVVNFRMQLDSRSTNKTDISYRKPAGSFLHKSVVLSNRLV